MSVEKSDLFKDVADWILATLQAGDVFKAAGGVPLHTMRDGSLEDVVLREVESGTGLSALIVAPRLAQRARKQPATLQCVLRVFEDTVVNASGHTGTSVLLHAWAMLDGVSPASGIWGDMQCQEIVLTDANGNRLTWDLNMMTEIVLTTKEQ